MGLTRLSHDLRLPAAVLILAYFLLYGLAVLAVWRWSRRVGWSVEHRFALAAGALLTYAWYGVVQVQHDALDLTGQAIFALVAAVGLVILGSRRVRTDKSMIGLDSTSETAGSTESTRTWSSSSPSSRP